MPAPDLDVLLTAKDFPEKRAAGFWVPIVIAVVITLMVATAIGIVGIVLLAGSLANQTSRNASRPRAELPRASADQRGLDASDHSDIEKRVLKFLSAGQQSKAEKFLDVEVGHFPKAVKFTELLATRKSREAKQFLKENSDEIQDGQRTFFLVAACARSRFDKKTAFNVFNAVSAMNPETPSGKCALYVIRLDSPKLRLASLQQVNKALADLRQLVDEHPDDIMMRWMLAVQCRNWDRNAEGARLYKQILAEWNPGPALVHQTYANVLDELGRYKEALAERYRVVKMEPAPWSYDGLGNTLNHLGRYKEGHKAHAMAVKLDPDSSLYWTNWAAGLNGDKQYDEAIEKCQRAIELDEQNWRAWWMWGMALEGKGNSQEALQKYKKGLAANPDSTFLQKLVADLEWRTGE